jgi:hypothetical protein
MKTKLLFLVSALAFAGITHAHNVPSSGIVEITDPAKIADIERRAHQMGAMHAPAEGGSKMSAEHSSMHERMHQSGARHEPGYKHDHENGYKHDHEHGYKHGYKHGHKGHPEMDGKYADKAHPMMDGKSPHGDMKRPMMDAPAKP